MKPGYERKSRNKQGGSTVGRVRDGEEERMRRMKAY